VTHCKHNTAEEEKRRMTFDCLLLSLLKGRHSVSELVGVTKVCVCVCLRELGIMCV